MVERSGRFRVYRAFESVPQINLQQVDPPTLYTVYQSGYGGIQGAVDDLETGHLLEATLEGDPDAEAEPWRLTALDTVGRVPMGFAVDVEPPDVARERWRPDSTEPAWTVLTEGEGEEETPVGACGLQPRATLPSGAFVPNVLAGLLPMEPFLSSIPGVEKPAAEALFLDPDPPDAAPYSYPYGVVVLFAEAASRLPKEFREAYDCPRGEDTRPAFDPYGM